MRWHPTVLSLLLRCVSALLLVAFVGAQVTCFIHCNVVIPSVAQASVSCHSTAQLPPCHSSSKTTPSSPEQKTSCLSYKNLMIGEEAPTLASKFLPHSFSLSLPEPILTLLQLSHLESFFRPALPPDWLLTPEVRLGPALRSLAPPFFG